MKKHFFNICISALCAVLLLASAVVIEAQNRPVLLSPENNARYVTTQKLRLTWLEVADANSYKVEVATSQSFSSQSIQFDFTRSTSEAVISDLPNNTTYWWRVRVSNTNDWSDTSKFTTTDLPRPVKVITPTDGANNQNPDLVFFEWEKDSANVKFNLQMSSDPEFPNILRDITTYEDTVEVSLLSTGKIYYWRIRSYNIDQVEGKWSDVFSFKTLLPKPGLIAPANFSGNRDTSLTFRWSKVDLAGVYDFQLSLNDTFKIADLIENSSTPYTQIKVNALLTDTIYYWRVKSRNAFTDTSRWSEPFTFKTKLNRPKLLAPMNKTRNHEIGQVELKWGETKLFDFYRVQVSTDTNFIKIISDSYSENHSTRILNLKYNTRYYWRVNARNSVGDTSYWAKYYWFKTKLPKPELISPENNSVQLALKQKFYWSKIDSAETYLFQLGEDSLFASAYFEKSVKETSVEVKSLLPFKEYFWRVKAENSFSDTSLWSKSFKLSTSALTFPQMSIDTTINFSKFPVDTIASFIIKNNADISTSIDRIFASPDTLFKVDNDYLSILPNDTGIIKLIADTSNIKTGLYSGYIGLIKKYSESRDTITVPVKLFAQKAIASISIDTLEFDTTLSVSPAVKDFRLSNRDGNITLALKKIYIEGRDSLAFKILTDVKNINARDSVVVSVRFDPIRLDSNKAALVVKSNSYPHNFLRLPITGIGKGGLLSDSTKAQLSNLKESVFYGLTDKIKTILFKNEGNVPLEINFGLVKNYFKVVRKTASNIKLLPGDTSSIKLEYITPNFDSLNIDTLYVYNTGIGKKLFKYILKGSFDSIKTTGLILSKLKIADENLDQVKNGFSVPQNTSIISRLTSGIFSDEANLDFRISYYTGGPGNKQRTIKTADNKFIIPYRDVDQRGLVFKGELFTNGMANQLVDSLTIFGFIDVQVLLNNYKTPDIIVPASVPAESADKADVNWVLFGYPFEQVLSDSVFKYLDKPAKMEDGKWVVYKYDVDSDNGFTLANQPFLTAGNAYFVAQSVFDKINLAYTYNNTVTTRKLSDTLIYFNSENWKTIASPYTFDVEVDTPAVIYRFDISSNAYRLTNIMRPGEGYFVPPQVKEIRLKTFGEYFPVLFPKLLSDSDWRLSLQASGNFKTEELYVSSVKSAALSKLSSGNLLYNKAPKVDNYFDFYFIGQDNQKYSVGITKGEINQKWNVVLESYFAEEISVRLKHSDDFPEVLNYALIDNHNNKVVNNSLSLGKKETKNLTLIVGSKDYIANEIAVVNSTPNLVFNLKQNYPNPFNPSTIIEYSIPNQPGSVFVSLIIYDVLGREVVKLVNEIQAPGNYSVKFDGSFDGSSARGSAVSGLASGLYIYRLNATSINGGHTFTSSAKMMLVK